VVALSFILDHGADVETELRVPILDMNSSMPLLMVASLKNQESIARVLIEKGADIRQIEATEVTFRH